jgi:putative transposase
VVTPDQQRAAADYLSDRYKVSQRRICRVMGRSRSVLRYRPSRQPHELPLVREIKRLARRHPRYGYRRIHALLVRGGWSVNLKRVHRLWNSLGLRRPLRLRKPRKLGPKRGTSANSCVQQPARFKNDIWTCDFIHDRTVSGRPLMLFLDYDLFERFGGIALHTRLLGEAGFTRVDLIWQQSPVAILAAYCAAES